MKINVLIALILFASISQGKIKTCTETAESVIKNSYGNTLTIEVSENQQEMIVSIPITTDGKAYLEIVKRDDSDTSSDEHGNLDESYNRQMEARFSGSSDLVSSDTGTSIFVDNNILAGKPGLLRMSGGQGNESDSGMMILWFEEAVLTCK